MAPKHATTGTQDRYRALCQLAPEHTMDGPQKSEYSFGGRVFHRTISDTEYLLADPNTGEVVFSFPLPMIALQVRDRSVASYSIKGVHMAYPTKQWERKRDEFQEQYARRNVELPAVFSVH